MVVGTALGWNNLTTFVLAVELAFFFGITAFVNEAGSGERSRAPEETKRASIAPKRCEPNS